MILKTIYNMLRVKSNIISMIHQTVFPTDS